MVRYKSYSRQTKTYYGVTFEYEDVKDVKGYINDKDFLYLGRVEVVESETKDSKVMSSKVEKPVEKIAKTEDKKPAQKATPKSTAKVDKPAKAEDKPKDEKKDK